MTAATLYRIASVLLLLFALGHTVGFLTLKPPTPESAAVHDAMNNVRFPVGGRTSTYGGFYVGFGLFDSAFLLFSAFVAWTLASAAGGAASRFAAALGWGLCVVMLASLALCLAYFNLVAIAFSAVLAVCLGCAAWLSR